MKNQLYIAFLYYLDETTLSKIHVNPLTSVLNKDCEWRFQMNPTEDNTPIPSAVIALDTKELLRNAFDIYTDKLPLQACKSEWKKENVFGFLMGVVEYGDETHVNELNAMLQSIPQAEAQKRSFLKEKQERYIDRFYDYYISPFLKYNGRIQYTDSDHESYISDNSTPRSRNAYLR